MKKIFVVILLAAITVAASAYTSDYNNIRNIYGNEAIQGGQPQETQQLQQQDAAQEQAAKQQAAQKEQAKSLGEVVVTARQVPETIVAVPRSVEVITAKEIKSKGAQSAAEALGNDAGLLASSYGGYELLSTLSIRGAVSKHALVMVDSIPLNDITSGGVDLSLVDITNTGKIEIIKEGMSSVYGQDAAAGVVNFISGPEEKKFAKGSASYGSGNKQHYTAGSTYKLFNTDFSLSGMQESGNMLLENSDYLKRNFSGRVSFGEGMSETQASGYYFKRDMGVPYNQFGATPNARQAEENFAFGAEETLDVGMAVIKIKGYTRSADMGFKDNAEYYTIDARHKKREHQGSLLVIYTEKDLISSITGYEANVKTAVSSSIGNKEITNNAFYENASLSLFGGAIMINGGSRLDMNSAFGTMDSEHAGVKVKLGSDLSVRGLFEKSFSAPAMNDLYWPQEATSYVIGSDTYTYIMKGNPDLKPETSYSWEAAVSKSGGQLSEELVVYYRDVANLISWKETVEGFTTTSMPVNVKKSRITGAEAKVRFSPFDFAAITGQAGLIYVRDPDAANAQDSDAIADAGKTYAAALELMLPLDIKLNITAKYYDLKKDTRNAELKPFFLAGLCATQKLSQNATAYIKAANLFDNTKYVFVNGYPMPGRQFHAGLEVAF